MAVTRMRRNSVWDTIQFSLNGIIFVLLGEQLPSILAGAKQTVAVTGPSSLWWLPAHLMAIVVGLATPRRLWVWASLRLTIPRNAYKGVGSQGTHWRLIAATSHAGELGRAHG